MLVAELHRDPREHFPLAFELGEELVGPGSQTFGNVTFSKRMRCVEHDGSVAQYVVGTDVAAQVECVTGQVGIEQHQVGVEAFQRLEHIVGVTSIFQLVGFVGQQQAQLDRAVLVVFNQQHA